MIKEELDLILNSRWCSLPEVWKYSVRSNSPLRILDLTSPDTYGIHVSYSILTDELLYVLITLPEDMNTTHLITSDSRFNREVYNEENSTRVVFYRKELSNA